MRNIAIIGGSGLSELAGLTNIKQHRCMTRYGQPSGPILQGTLEETEIYFVARHGTDHSIAPHRINYRANIAALMDLQVTDVLAVTAVGGIVATTPPRKIVIPEQIIDYTYAREHTFSDGLDSSVKHIDFSHPYSAGLRQELITTASAIELVIEPQGVYGATQGPRLETAAEITRMAQDGCTLVGMTGMPEASLAREAGLDYANCSLVVNWAAGVTGGTIDLVEIEHHLQAGITDVVALLSAWLRRLSSQ